MSRSTHSTDAMRRETVQLGIDAPLDSASSRVGVVEDHEGKLGSGENGVLDGSKGLEVGSELIT